VGPAPGRRRVELADLVRAHGAAVRQGQRLTRGQHRALRAIAACRTAALGGHTEACDVCGATRIAYNSCRNRHCPKCQTLAKERWLAARRADLLPIEYFHVVFPLPHALNPLAQGNPRVLYTLLFAAATETLAAFGDDPRHLGGRLGIVAILHTWGQTLVQHLHLHCVVTGGALARDGSRWLPAKRGFLFPVRALAPVFRAKYLEGLQRAFDRGALRFAGSVAGLAEPTTFAAFLATLRATDWVVYAKPPFGGPAQVLEYLGRYTHRVAISNDRLVSLADGIIRFRWKDYARGNRVKTMALIHEKLYRSRDLDGINLGEYLRDLVAFLANSYRLRSNGTNIVVDAPDVQLGLEKAVSCGLIVNELVSNALKHAFPDQRSGSIVVRLAGDRAEGLELTVADDGVGLPKGVHFDETDTLGLRLVRSLADQLDGAINVQNGRGTMFRLTFPIK